MSSQASPAGTVSVKTLRKFKEKGGEIHIADSLRCCIRSRIGWCRN